MTPRDEAYLIWVTYDADRLYDEYLIPEGFDVSLYTREEVRKVWNGAAHLFDPGVVSLAQRNVICASYVIGFVTGAVAGRLGWPEEPLDDPGPLREGTDDPR